MTGAFLPLLPAAFIIAIIIFSCSDKRRHAASRVEMTVRKLDYRALIQEVFMPKTGPKQGRCYQ